MSSTATITATELNKKVLSPDVAHKIWSTVKKDRDQIPKMFPHFTYPDRTDYYYTEPHKWTAGFFPGTVWALYERSLKNKDLVPLNQDELLKEAQRWAAGIESQQFNKNTHDIGFLIMPSFLRMHKLTGDKHALDVIVQAAESLCTRFSETTKLIRSWDVQENNAYSYMDMDKYYLVIIDNMMNLDLLYYASEQTGNPKYAKVATTHATTSLDLFFRSDNSTYHLVVLNTQTGEVIKKLTHQGYANESCWSRGQAWALYGYASAFKYTGDKKFLDAAKRAADLFTSRIGENGSVRWDFDAPLRDDGSELWDVSAAMIATSGMLLIQELDKTNKYTESTYRIINRVVEDAVVPELQSYLGHSTVNNNKDGKVEKVADTGLVYADYYFVETGNRLLDMKLI